MSLKIFSSPYNQSSLSFNCDFYNRPFDGLFQMSVVLFLNRDFTLSSHSGINLFLNRSFQSSQSSQSFLFLTLLLRLISTTNHETICLSSVIIMNFPEAVKCRVGPYILQDRGIKWGKFI